MRIAVFEIEDWERKAFQDLRDAHNVQFVVGPLNEENAGRFEDSEIVSVFIYSDLDDSALRQLDRLKLISTRSTGHDHIDLQVFKDKKIAVCNVPEYGENTVAEHVFGLLLTMSHHLYEAIDRTRKGDTGPGRGQGGGGGSGRAPRGSGATGSSGTLPDGPPFPEEGPSDAVSGEDHG